jgi:hypothetical protein
VIIYPYSINLLVTVTEIEFTARYDLHLQIQIRVISSLNEVLWFLPVGIVPPMPHTDLDLLLERKMDGAWEPSRM